MTDLQLAGSFRRIAEDLLASGYPANSSAKAIQKEADRLDPPRKPREWTLVECQGELYSKFDGVFPKYIKVREVIE